MSIPSSTNYIANNTNYPMPTDLINIFQPYSSIQVTANPTTNYIINGSGNPDLGQIFVEASPIGSGTSQPTGFQTVIGGITYDLSEIFQAFGSLPFTATGTYSYIYDYLTNTYYLTFTNNGTLTFVNDIIGYINMVVIGGGGSGAGTSGAVDTAGGGGGGGGAIDVQTTMTTSTTTGIVKNTLYTINLGTGGVGGTAFGGTAGSPSTFTLTGTDIITSTGGGGGIRESASVSTNAGGGIQGASSINAGYTSGFTSLYSISGLNGGPGGNTTAGANYTGNFGYSSSLSYNYYNSGSGTIYTNFANTFLIYNWMLFSGGGGGATDGLSSDGFSAWGGNGLSEFAGGLYGYTTNTEQSIQSSTFYYGQNNDPPTSANFPTFSNAVSAVSPGGGGAGIGYYLYNTYSIGLGGSGGNGTIKVYFNYSPPPLPINTYFNITGNAKTYLMNSSSTNYYIINCYAGSSTVTFTTSVTCTIIAVAGGGGGAGSVTHTPLTSGAGGGGGGAGVYSYTFTSGSYTINVGTGGTGGIGANSGIQGISTTILDSSSSTLISCTGGGGGTYSTTLATGGAVGTLGGTLTATNGGSGGAGGQGSENGPDPSPTLTSANQASYGITSTLTSTTLPDGTVMYLSGGGAAGSCEYNSSVAPANYYGGGAGHGYGGWVGASYTNSNTTYIGNINGANALCYGAGGGGGSSNGSPTSGGNGSNGIVLIYFPVP